MSSLVNFHIPVLCEQALQLLVTQRGGCYIDCTFGRGGYTRELLSRLSDAGRVIALDRDPDAIEYGMKYLQDERLQLKYSDFAQVDKIVTQTHLEQLVDGAVADLGLSSPQVDNASRGFSFMYDGPLDMRMNNREGINAAQWLQRASEQEVADVLWKYGEERRSRKIAKVIKSQYPHNPIKSTKQLADLITTVVPFNPKHKKHPATCSFQAIRIFINDELGQLEKLLHNLLGILKVGGRIVVVSFHSLEDRIVKRFFKSLCVAPRLPKELPVIDNLIRPNWKLVGKPIYASESEVTANPRARSAVLRCIEKVS